MTHKSTIDDIAKISDDLARNDAIYNLFDEANRLKSGAGAVEFITTMRAIEEVLKPGDKILDIGAGTGAYARPLARMGHRVTAFEPARQNYDQFQKFIETEPYCENIMLKQASSFDLGELQDDEFDVVLLLGPLYHLSDAEDRAQVLQEARRVCKAGGVVLVAFINHDMIPVTETIYDENWFAGETYNHKTMRVDNFPFQFFTLEESSDMLNESGLIIEKTIASDGFSEVLAQQLNRMNEQAYKQYLVWHSRMCEKIEMLAATNHFLFVCRNRLKYDTSQNIDTDRLILKPLSEEVASDMLANFTEEVVKFMYPAATKSIDESLAFIRSMQKMRATFKDLVYSIHLQQTEEFIGCVGLHRLDSAQPEIGIWTKVSSHGNGYGREAVGGVIQLARTLGYRELKYPVDCRNIPSRKIPISFGGVLVAQQIPVKTPDGRQLTEEVYHLSI